MILMNRLRQAASSRIAFPTIAAVLLVGMGTPAHAGLTINATFNASLTSAEQGAINAAISSVEASISSPNNISVNIYFNSMTSGLGESLTSEYGVSYDAYYNALKAVATQPNQLTALASLGAAPTGPGSDNPVTGTANMAITSAEGRNLGFATPGGVTVSGVSGTFDTEILLNTSITSPPEGLAGFYGLQAVANHEIDESLGIGGTGSTLGDSGIQGVYAGDLDVYRWSCGVAIVGTTCSDPIRSYTTSATAVSYFSIDGGHTILSYFNQVAGADYADWASDPIPAGFSPQVQDAFGEPGTNPTLGVNELTAFNAIGYDLIPSSVPEPSSILLLGSVVGIVGIVNKRRLGGWMNRQS
jgi:hypothetical protein